MHKTEYRPDIDGLRALAIIPVLWFHSGLPGLPGGFTGVDTFFVISGYLISLIIHREVKNGSFTFSRFYERRIRRIAPALLIVLTATLAVGSYLLLPWELVKLGQSSIAAIGMVANVYFWRDAGYFALGEGITPLLHTWSLGIEEQFYLFFPLALIIAERLKIVKVVVVAIAVSSFVMCVIAMSYSPSATFYLLPTRAWELMIGALLAVGIVRIPLKLRPIAAAAGLVLLVVAAVLISKDSAFPGWRAGIPAIGAMLIIGSGPKTYVNRLIANRSFIWIGKISYSLYLWHWPVFAFMRHHLAERSLPASWAIAGILLSTLLAWMTYRWVEQPARRRSVPYRRVAIAAGASALWLAAVAVGAIVRGGFPERLDSDVVELAERRNDLAPLAHKCVNSPLSRIYVDCHLGPAGQPRFIIWGDSHAAAVSEGVAEGIGRPGVLSSMNTCAPALDWVNSGYVGTDGPECAARNDALLKRVATEHRIKTVVLSAYWPMHVRDGGAEMWAGVQKLTNRLNAADKNVIVVAGIPEPGADVPWAGAIRARFNRAPLHWSCPAANVPVRGATIIDLAPAFCADSRPDQLFADANHSSRTAGLRLIAPALASLQIDD